MSTANGARLINEAIHLNDRAKAACSFHARNVGAVRRTRFRLYARRVYYWSRCTWAVCTHVVTWIYIYNRPTRFRSTRVILISHRHAIYIYICIVTYIFWAWISLGSSIIYKLERFNEACHFDDSIKIALTKIRFTFAFQVESKNLVYSVIVVRNVARRILRTG